MKKAILILSFWGLFYQVTAPPPIYLRVVQKAPINPYEQIWSAVCMVESGGNRFAVGDMHLTTHSYGIVQIRQERLTDYNRLTGSNYSLMEMFEVDKSKKVFMFFASQYSPEDIEGIARSWNGRGASSAEYIEKVKKRM